MRSLSTVRLVSYFFLSLEMARLKIMFWRDKTRSFDSRRIKSMTRPPYREKSQNVRSSRREMRMTKDDCTHARPDGKKDDGDDLQLRERGGGGKNGALSPHPKKKVSEQNIALSQYASRTNWYFAQASYLSSSSSVGGLS